MPEIGSRMEANDGTIVEEDIRKIEKYYGLAVPAILAEAYADLRGKRLTERERRAATYLGAATGLFDDYFDRGSLPDDYLKNLYTFPEQFTGQNSNERLTNFCWANALSNTRSPALLMEYAAKVHEAQIESRGQTLQSLSEAGLRQVTFDKGGYSVIFYLSLFYEQMPKADENLFYQTGALLQLENDLFDVYKDYQAGIKTLVTSAGSIRALRQEYQLLWENLKQSMAPTHYPAGGKRAFKQLICALVCRGFVCLDMLEKLEAQNKGVFNPAAFTRKELICDMEKPANLLRTIRYYILMF